MEGFSLVRLQNASSVEEELNVLEQLKGVLLPLRPARTESDDDFENEWLRRGGAEIENPFPSRTPENLLHIQSDLEIFTFYLFERRFGWSEYASSTDLEDDDHGLEKSNSRRESVTSIRVLEETKFKGRINELLDEFLKWYVAQPVLSVRLLESLKYAILQANAMPVVRNQTFVHVMDWLKHTTDCGLNETVFTLVEDLIVLGLTDVWSAIRNTCVARLSPVLDHLDITQMEVLFTSLTKICQAKESSWQAKEGAVMGMTAAVRKFQWIGLSTEEKDGVVSDSKRYVLKYGRKKLESLPSYIMDSVHTVLYSLLAHPQLSIREHATKSFSSILSRCEFQEALSSFQEVTRRLCRGTQFEGYEDGKLPHNAVVRQDFKFLKAYEAEGLLGVCVFLIKHIPPGFLLPNWPLYFSTFNLYLMHPASTVRQATSAVFKYLVAKDSSNPVLLKLVLQGLAADWNIDAELMNRALSASSRTLNHDGVELSDLSDAMRLLQSEARVACDDYQTTESVTKGIFLPSPTPPPSPSPSPIPVSHWLPTDSVSGIGPSPPTPNSASTSLSDQIGNVCLGHPGSWPSHKPRRIGIRHVARLATESEKSTESLVSEAWEWREGRLFGYELILKLLITNHIHYLFPSFVLPTAHARATASVDENLMGRAWTELTSPVVNSLHTVNVEAEELHKSKSEFPASFVLKSHSSSTIPLTRALPLHTTTSIKEGESGFTALNEKSNGSGKDPESLFYNARQPLPRKPMRSSSFDIPEGICDSHRIFRHFSLASQVIPSRPFRPPKTQGLSLANSLLSQTKIFDAEENAKTKKSRTCSYHIGSSLKSPIAEVPFEAVGGLAVETKLLHSLTLSSSPNRGRDLPGWTKAIKLEAMSTILCQVLLQAIECLADSRWELRRMSQQVLPLVTETVRWFDISILEELWDQCLTPERTLLCYGSCLALKHSIIHAGRLVNFLESPPATWKDPESCSRVAQSIVSAVQRGLPKWMQQVHAILRYPSCDKLTVVAMETIMSSHISFSLNPDTCEKVKEEETLLIQILIIFINSFPENALAIALKNLPKFEDVQPFLAPSEGFLSCSSKVTSHAKHAQQVGKYAISEVHGLLSRFLKTCQVKELVIVFPVLIHYMGEFSEDPTICKSLIDGLYSTICLVKTLLSREDSSWSDLQTAMETYFDFAILEISNLIMSKVLDLCMVRQLLDVFSRVCELIKRPTFLGFIFKAISLRLDFEPDLVRLMSASEDSSRANTPDLCILSNDIPTSPVDEAAFPTEDEEEPENGRVMHESLALDTSQDSGKMTACVNSPESNDESDATSDWDSWEDEDEDQTALIAVFADFLHHISDMYKAKSQGVSIFDEELGKCGFMEKKVVANILESGER